MKVLRFISLIWIILFTFQQLSAQECFGPRYKEKVFADITFTPNIDYGGLRKNPVGAPTKLLADMYEPKGDTAALRPLVFMIHGGAFLDIPILDRRSPDIGTIAVDMAKRGYVVVSPEYRLVKNLLSLVDEAVMTKAVIASMIDINDAICFFVDSYYNGNPYRIDINKIFVGGVSAGAVITTQGQFVNDTSELNEYRRGIIREVAAFDNRNIQEILTNKYCGANVLGSLCISTMLLDTNLIKPTTTACFFSHGTADNITPFGEAKPFGIPTLPTMYGPGVIAEKIKATGTRVDFDIWQDSWHVPFLEIDLTELLNLDLNDLLWNYDILDSTLNHMSNFCFELMNCKTATPTALNKKEIKEIRIFPNPSGGEFSIALPTQLNGKTVQYKLMNALGQVVSEEIFTVNQQQIKINGIAPGNYFLSIMESSDASITYTGRIMIY